jgi:hypothetical protein
VSVDESARDARLSWLAVAVGATICASAAVVGADARWLAALGRTIVHAGSIPSVIPYAAAPSSDWVNVPVLGEIVFHWLEALGGDRGVLFAQAVAVAIALSLLLRDMRAAGAPDGARALVIAAIPFASIPSVFIARSQLFSLALFPLLLLLLRSEARSRSRRIWLLVPLVALWSNLHGAVLVGLAVAGVYLLLDRIRYERWTALAVVIASVCALFATPALDRTGAYYLGVLHSEPAAKGDGLWAPLSLSSPFDVIFVVFAILLIRFALRTRPKGWELVCLAMLSAATVHVGRNSIWLLLLVATPAAVGLGQTRLRRIKPARRAVHACAWCVPALFLVLAVTRTPMQTVAGTQLRAQAASLAGGEPILADGGDAEQLALDGRRVWIANPIDAFDRADQRLYLDWVEGLPTGDRLLRGQRVVLVRGDTERQRRLARNAAFREVARDSSFVLYARRPD